MPFSANTIGSAGLGTFAGGVFSDTYSATSSNDVEIVALDLVAGRLYEVDGDGTAGDAYIRIFDQFGNEVKAIDDDFDSGEAFSLDFYTQFVPNYTGRYYFAVSNTYLTEYDPDTTAGRPTVENPGTFATGSLIVTDTGPTFFPDANSINAITAKTTNDESDVAQNEGGQVRIEYGSNTFLSSTDVEMGRFDLSKGDTVVVDVNGQVAAGNILDSVLRIFDDNGNQIGLDIGSGNGADSELIFVAPNSDDFYVAVSGTGNAAYNAVDGTGITASDTGEFQVIIHRNANLVGTSLANSVSGLENADYVVGLAGNDTLTGNGGNDTLAGGDDNDSLLGSAGEDQLYGEFNNDTLDGGAGSDALNGGFGDDSLLGGFDNAADRLEGAAGNDTLGGGRGDDTLDGGTGNDVLVGADNADSMLGGSGLDTLNGGNGNDTMDGGADADQLLGSQGFDQLAGGLGNDTLDGGTQDDTLVGGDGGDVLRGGTGPGADLLRGGLGNDSLTGGDGADTFDFDATNEGVDTILDFVLATDRIDLSTIFDATGAAVTSANLAEFIQTTPAGGGASSFLAVDANGFVGGSSFTTIALVNNITSAQLFDASNFVL